MPWFYVDDGFSDSKPVLNLSARHRLAACGLWVLAGSWSAKEETDGFVPDVQLRRLGSRPALVDALTEEGPMEAPLWSRVESGVVFNSWSKWQKTRAELAAKRRADAERQQKHRSAKRKGRNHVVSGNADESQCDTVDLAKASEMPVTHGVTRDSPRACVDPTRPDPTPSKDLGGECPVETRDGLPPRYCPEHPNGTNRGCGPCRDARLRREAAEKTLAQDELDTKRRQRDAAANCRVCQGTNWLPDTDPAVKCHHQETAHA